MEIESRYSLKMTMSDFDEDDDEEFGSTNRSHLYNHHHHHHQSEPKSTKVNKFNLSRYKLLEITVQDYSWNIIDLFDNNKKKLLFKVNVNKHVRLLKVLDKLNHENVWKWSLFKDKDIYYAIELQDYYQVSFFTESFFFFAIVFLNFVVLIFKLSDSLSLVIRNNKLQGTQIDESQIVKWLKQILSAVSCLHQENILILRLDS